MQSFRLRQVIFEFQDEKHNYKSERGKLKVGEGGGAGREE